MKYLFALAIAHWGVVLTGIVALVFLDRWLETRHNANLRIAKLEKDLEAADGEVERACKKLEAAEVRLKQSSVPLRELKDYWIRGVALLQEYSDPRGPIAAWDLTTFEAFDRDLINYGWETHDLGISSTVYDRIKRAYFINGAREELVGLRRRDPDCVAERIRDYMKVAQLSFEDVGTTDEELRRYESQRFAPPVERGVVVWD